MNRKNGFRIQIATFEKKKIIFLDDSSPFPRKNRQAVGTVQERDQIYFAFW